MTAPPNPDTNTYVLRRPVREASFRLDYAALLNPPQLDAVTTTEGPVLVIAGAGSGKTRTLVFRVARLVEQGVDPHAVLLLTFTRKAASEMLRRAAGLLDGRCEQVGGGTFHSFANLTLRRHGGVLGLSSGFTILDRGDGEDVIGLLRARLGLDKKERRFPRKQTIAELFSASVNRDRTLAVLLDEHYAHLAEHGEDLIALAAAYRAYKAERQVVDYDDLLVQLHELLAVHPDVRRHLAQRHRYLMVDEYQDTNPLQAGIVRLLAAEHGNVMAVGDDAQSIYGFRGADFRNIMQFPTLFPGTRVIALEENYRSAQPVLDVANAIMDGARERYTKVLFTRQGDGAAPLLIAAEHENFQSRFVCQRILELREEGVPLAEIAILVRSSFHAFDLELELARADLPFVKRGGFRFIESAHVKDAMAHLRVIENPRDAISWHRLLLLLEGVGPRTADDISGRLLGSVDVPATLESIVGRAYSTDLLALAGLLRRIGASGRRPDEQLGEVLRYYEPLLRRRHPDDHPKRQRDLEHFVSIAARYRTLQPLLADMALDPPSDSVNDVIATDHDEGLLTLSTIHSAKGLEWHTVFVIWMVDGKFPSTYSMHSDDELEEERRLLYVAVTRAKRHLYLSYPINMYDRGIGLVLSKPSRLLDGVPRRLLKPMTLTESFD